MNLTVDFAGITVDNVTLAQALEKTQKFLSVPADHLIVTPNPEMIVAAQNDQELKNILNQADLKIPDGISMIVVSRILGKPLQERVAGIDLMLKLTEICAHKGYRIFLLGSLPGVAEQAARNLLAQYPHLQISGTHHGYFTGAEEREIIQKIKSSNTQILFAGLGAVRQEKWLAHHRLELNVPLCMGIGGSLDVIGGKIKRASRMIQNLYLEWLYRLITQPWRGKRQLALIQFLGLMFKPKLTFRSLFSLL